jgi:glycosyltransferase involved in cell wall biosynthesis
VSNRTVHFFGPVLTASGYGVHARQVLKALVDSQYDVYVEAVRWGETPQIDNHEVEWIKPLIEKWKENPGAKRDISVQVTIPNEFKRCARLNIGVTAGIEVDRVSPSWLQKVNDEVDLLIVPSKHSAETFKNTKYKSNDGNILALNVPVIVVPESVPEEFVADRSLKFSRLDDSLPSSNLLVVGLGLDRAMGEDRKNISNTIFWFLKEFAGREDVGLVLKVSMINNTLLDREAITNRIKSIREASGVGKYPKITLLHGMMSTPEMCLLYNDKRIKGLVSLTHGEGFGLPMLEALACGLPVAATSWSGHLDFLLNDFVPIQYKVEKIPQSFVWPGVVEQDSQWASVDETSARLAMKTLIEDDGTLAEKAMSASERVRISNSQYSLCSSFKDILADAWKQVVRLRPETREETVAVLRDSFTRKQHEETLIFTMPMSGGDVYLSTGVLNAVLSKIENENGGIRPYVFFATKQQYRSILDDNTDIDEIIEWQPWMQDVGLLEDTFTHVYTPNLPIQMVWSNWVHRGKGRNILDEMAVHCNLQPNHWNKPRISLVPINGIKEDCFNVVIHTGSGHGQWGARRYNNWQDVVDNIKRLWDESFYGKNVKLSIYQVGLPDEPELKNVIDMRGRTPLYGQLAYVVSKADVVVSIDSIVMHLAAHNNIMHVSLFGGSYSKSTGAVSKAAKQCLIETDDRNGCERACYKNECSVDKENPCINNISPINVVESFFNVAATKTKDTDVAQKVKSEFKFRTPTISGYTHTFNAKKNGYPFVQSIKSMLGFCSEVVVVDGGSTDGTIDDLKEINDPKLKVIHNAWDDSEPGMDGMQKAFGRMFCDPSSEFLWQQDCDEIVHESDYEKIISIAKMFPPNVDLIHLPVVELWGDDKHFRTDRHAWKWRMSRNVFNVTHGIVDHARLTGDDGRTYAKEGMSDGCEYIDMLTGKYVPHVGFWNERLEKLRVNDPVSYGKEMNLLFDKLPCVWHYSWADIPRKIRNFRDFWDTCWSNLYRRPLKKRFPDVVTDEDIVKKANEVKLRGGEHQQSVVIELEKCAPAIMDGWIGQ